MVSHSKPSVNAKRNGWVALVILETIGAYAALYAISGQSWYNPAEVMHPTVSAYSTSPSSINLGYLAKDAQIILTFIVWVVYSVLVWWSMFHDWPVTPKASDIYNATHVNEDRHIQPVLKLGDDLAAILRNKGSGTRVASTLYEDYQAIKNSDNQTPEEENNGNRLENQDPVKADQHQDVVSSGSNAPVVK